MDTALFHGNFVDSSRILYTPSVFAKTNLIHLQEIGTLTAQKPHTSQRENLASYLFFTVIKGMGTLEYCENSYELRTGDCAFLDCRKAYAHRTSEKLWTLKWVHFYGPNMNGIYEKYAERGGQPAFHAREPERYLELLRQLHEVAAGNAYIRDMHIYEKLTALLTLLMEESWNPQSNARGKTQRQNLQNIKDYLDQNYPQKISLDDLAEHFYINKFYLTKIFKEQFGLSITNYLAQVRITHAKQLLRFTNLSVEKIGAECGMSDANYFSRVFKKVEGISPGEFRKLW